MIKPDMIPDEVVEAAAITLMGRLMVSQQDALHVWSGMYELEKEQFRREARASIIAALQAWPGMMPVSEVFTAGGDFYRPHLILPLPQEARDE